MSNDKLFYASFCLFFAKYERISANMKKKTSKPSQKDKSMTSTFIVKETASDDTVYSKIPHLIMVLSFDCLLTQMSPLPNNPLLEDDPDLKIDLRLQENYRYNEDYRTRYLNNTRFENEPLEFYQDHKMLMKTKYSEILDILAEIMDELREIIRDNNDPNNLIKSLLDKTHIVIDMFKLNFDHAFTFDTLLKPYDLIFSLLFKNMKCLYFRKCYKWKINDDEQIDCRVNFTSFIKFVTKCVDPSNEIQTNVNQMEPGEYKNLLESLVEEKKTPFDTISELHIEQCNLLDGDLNQLLTKFNPQTLNFDTIPDFSYQELNSYLTTDKKDANLTVTLRNVDLGAIPICAKHLTQLTISHCLLRTLNLNDIDYNRLNRLTFTNCPNLTTVVLRSLRSTDSEQVHKFSLDILQCPKLSDIQIHFCCTIPKLNLQCMDIELQFANCCRLIQKITEHFENPPYHIWRIDDIDISILPNDISILPNSFNLPTSYLYKQLYLYYLNLLLQNNNIKNLTLNLSHGVDIYLHAPQQLSLDFYYYETNSNIKHDNIGFSPLLKQISSKVSNIPFDIVSKNRYKQSMLGGMNSASDDFSVGGPDKCFISELYKFYTGIQTDSPKSQPDSPKSIISLYNDDDKKTDEGWCSDLFSKIFTSNRWNNDYIFRKHIANIFKLLSRLFKLYRSIENILDKELYTSIGPASGLVLNIQFFKNLIDYIKKTQIDLSLKEIEMLKIIYKKFNLKNLLVDTNKFSIILTLPINRLLPALLEPNELIGGSMSKESAKKHAEKKKEFQTFIDLIKKNKEEEKQNKAKEAQKKDKIKQKKDKIKQDEQKKKYQSYLKTNKDYFDDFLNNFDLFLNNKIFSAYHSEIPQNQMENALKTRLSILGKLFFSRLTKFYYFCKLPYKDFQFLVNIIDKGIIHQILNEDIEQRALQILFDLIYTILNETKRHLFKFPTKNQHENDIILSEHSTNVANGKMYGSNCSVMAIISKKHKKIIDNIGSNFKIDQQWWCQFVTLCAYCNENNSHSFPTLKPVYECKVIQKCYLDFQHDNNNKDNFEKIFSSKKDEEDEKDTKKANETKEAKEAKEKKDTEDAKTRLQKLLHLLSFDVKQGLNTLKKQNIIANLPKYADPMKRIGINLPIGFLQAQFFGSLYEMYQCYLSYTILQDPKIKLLSTCMSDESVRCTAQYRAIIELIINLNKSKNTITADDVKKDLDKLSEQISLPKSLQQTKRYKQKKKSEIEALTKKVFNNPFLYDDNIDSNQESETDEQKRFVSTLEKYLEYTPPTTIKATMEKIDWSYKQLLKILFIFYMHLCANSSQISDFIKDLTIEDEEKNFLKLTNNKKLKKILKEIRSHLCSLFSPCVRDKNNEKEITSLYINSLYEHLLLPKVENSRDKKNKNKLGLIPVSIEDLVKVLGNLTSSGTLKVGFFEGIKQILFSAILREKLSIPYINDDQSLIDIFFSKILTIYKANVNGNKIKNFIMHTGIDEIVKMIDRIEPLPKIKPPKNTLSEPIFCKLASLMNSQCLYDYLNMSPKDIKTVIIATDLQDLEFLWTLHKSLSTVVNYMNPFEKTPKKIIYSKLTGMEIAGAVKYPKKKDKLLNLSAGNLGFFSSSQNIENARLEISFPKIKQTYFDTFDSLLELMGKAEFNFGETAELKFLNIIKQAIIAMYLFANILSKLFSTVEKIDDGFESNHSDNIFSVDEQQKLALIDPKKILEEMDNDSFVEVVTHQTSTMKGADMNLPFLCGLYKYDYDYLVDKNLIQEFSKKMKEINTGDDKDKKGKKDKKGNKDKKDDKGKMKNEQIVKHMETELKVFAKLHPELLTADNVLNPFKKLKLYSTDQGTDLEISEWKKLHIFSIKLISLVWELIYNIWTLHPQYFVYNNKPIYNCNLRMLQRFIQILLEQSRNNKVSNEYILNKYIDKYFTLNPNVMERLAFTLQWPYSLEYMKKNLSSGEDVYGNEFLYFNNASLFPLSQAAIVYNRLPLKLVTFELSQVKFELSQLKFELSQGNVQMGNYFSEAQINKLIEDEKKQKQQEQEQEQEKKNPLLPSRKKEQKQKKVCYLMFDSTRLSEYIPKPTITELTYPEFFDILQTFCNLNKRCELNQVYESIYDSNEETYSDNVITTPTKIALVIFAKGNEVKDAIELESGTLKNQYTVQFKEKKKQTEKIYMTLLRGFLERGMYLTEINQTNLASKTLNECQDLLNIDEIVSLVFMSDPPEKPLDLVKTYKLMEWSNWEYKDPTKYETNVYKPFTWNDWERVYFEIISSEQRLVVAEDKASKKAKKQARKEAKKKAKEERKQKVAEEKARKVAEEKARKVAEKQAKEKPKEKAKKKASDASSGASLDSKTSETTDTENTETTNRDNIEESEEEKSEFNPDVTTESDSVINSDDMQSGSEDD